MCLMVDVYYKNIVCVTSNIFLVRFNIQHPTLKTMLKTTRQAPQKHIRRF